MMENKGKPDQSAEFIRIAKEIGADEDRSNADALLGKLARTPPDPKSKPKGARKRKPKPAK